MNASRIVLLVCGAVAGTLVVACGLLAFLFLRPGGRPATSYQSLMKPVVERIKQNPIVDDATAGRETFGIEARIRAKKGTTREEAKALAGEAITWLMDANPNDTREPGTPLCPTDFEYSVSVHSPGGSRLARVVKYKSKSELTWSD